MNPNTFATKGNLIALKNSLVLARQGYELMDKKRNILIREMMQLIQEASNVQTEIDRTFTEAYQALQTASMEHGMRYLEEVGFSVPVEDSVSIKLLSIMGTEIPLVSCETKDLELVYGYNSTSESLDIARLQFEKVKELTVKLSTIEISAYRLAASIKKTQKRANALKNITIPRYESLVHSITNELEEKEREEFTRLKVIKRMKDKNAG